MKAIWNGEVLSESNDTVVRKTTPIFRLRPCGASSSRTRRPLPFVLGKARLVITISM